MIDDPFASAALQLLPGQWPADQAHRWLHELIAGVEWSDDYYLAFGRRIPIPRLQAWYADPGIRYSYSNNLLPTLPWRAPLSEIRQHCENAAGHSFNSVLVTYYRDHNDSVSWHADDESELGDEPVIASLSLGAQREMHYRHKTSGRVGAVTLKSGDLLVMYPEFQHQWEHCVPSARDPSGPRINLTYRRVIA